MQLRKKQLHSKIYSNNGKSTLEVLEFAKNYNKWIASKLLPHITLPTLEIGAGTGNITKLISERKKILHISEIDSTLVTYLKKKFNNKRDYVIHTLDIENEIVEDYKEYFSSIYSVNVLEHIHNDQQALINMRKMLKHEGNVVLLVPAKKFAFTNLDKELGHYRRYEKKELVEILLASGFTVDKIEFFNIVGLLSWFIRDKIDTDHTQLKPYQIKLFEGIVPLLKVMESIITVPIGISLIAVGRKV